MTYPTLDICRQLLFPLVQKEMVTSEPAPPYAYEQRGLQRLESVFALMQRDDYEGFYPKAAYLFCSVIDGHPFSNGNKRLAVSLLTFFMVANGLLISGPSMEAVRDELAKAFPHLKWEDVAAFRRPHEYFFYHLALIIADRGQKGQMTFRQEQEAVQQLLKFISA